MARRERTRHLIELGGLVQKAGLVDLTDDDRATMLGGLLALADMLGGEGGAQLADVWRRRGLRAFETERLASSEQVLDGQPGSDDTDDQEGRSQAVFGDPRLGLPHEAAHGR